MFDSPPGTTLSQVAECARCGVALVRDAAWWTHALYHGQPCHRAEPLPITPGSYGIVAVPQGTPHAMTCGTCGRSWTPDITPSGRCPWEYEHYRIAGDA